MKTRLPISTIAYQSSDYLCNVLIELQKQKIISAWHFILHQPEDDEAGNKAHIHLWIEPARSIQTEDLRAELQQFDPYHPDKPLRCLSFRNSKRFGDWYLYAIHDPVYLASKMQSRKYHYSIQDVVTSDPDELQRSVREIEIEQNSTLIMMKQAILEGLTFADLFNRGAIPPQQAHSLEYAWNLLYAGTTQRNGRPNHEEEPNEPK